MSQLDTTVLLICPFPHTSAPPPEFSYPHLYLGLPPPPILLAKRLTSLILGKTKVLNISKKNISQNGRVFHPKVLQGAREAVLNLILALAFAENLRILEVHKTRSGLR